MNNLINQIVKIRLSQAGYLPDYPYHLISNVEMVDAFFETRVTADSNGVYVDTGFENSNDFFHQTYSYPREWTASALEAYQKLCRAIQIIVGNWKYLQAAAISSIIVDEDDVYCELSADKLPDWIYSYMLQRVVCPNSLSIDIHDLLVLLGIDNIKDEFTEEAAMRCYQISTEWLSKFPKIDQRPPSIFGEMHVIKSLRLVEQGV